MAASSPGLPKCMASFVAPLPRVVIERVSPELDGGRYPIKRTVGDLVKVEADIYQDGHDLIAARVLYRRGRERGWREAPLEYRYDVDRWFGRFRVDQPGRWQYCVEAWPDRFGTWRDHLEKFHAAGLGDDVAIELREGAVLLERALGQLPRSVRGAVRDAHSAWATRTGRWPSAWPSPFPSSSCARSTDRSWTEIPPGRTRSSWWWIASLPPSPPGTSCFRAHKAGPASTGRSATRKRLRELAALGFDVVYLPPIHPIGRHHRKGRNNSPEAEPGDVGSPWAIGSAEGGHTAVHPELGTLEDFASLVRTARSTGPGDRARLRAAVLAGPPLGTGAPGVVLTSAPTARSATRRIRPRSTRTSTPSTSGARTAKRLWMACRDVVLFWIEHGVTIFRVDNPHTKPLPVLGVADSRKSRRAPGRDLPGRGVHPPEAHVRACAKLGFSQSYTYFTWKNSKCGPRAIPDGAHAHGNGRVLPAELLREHAGHPARVPAERRSRGVPHPAPAGRDDLAAATASTAGSSSARTCPCSAGARSTWTPRSTRSASVTGTRRETSRRTSRA